MTIDRSKPVHASDAPLRASRRMSKLLLAGVLATQLAVLPLLGHASEAVPVATKLPAAAKLPKGFTAYGSTPIEGGECVAGDATREGLDGRAFVYFKDAKTQQPRWITAIPLPSDWYQNRATHCFAMGGSLFVLVQSDTSQRTSISQTLLNVVELSPTTGKIVANQDADVPGVDAGYSSWVDKGNEGFHEEKGQIKISGQYFLMSDPNKRIPFTVTLPAHASK
ncbi:hypothetical protein C8J98_104312 [Luteibacter sp. OK325]|uniref:hypothetical protein n=1 Tax=Luteibacter sp. OK325 TaxID=2135670 RepID=UPI000D36489F|nr:hypothetical protein [Luteibacter sp. OK325]PTR33096.1 hypothetical protein C8J98_104312 [Luteibacter sp. OK325]